jgi:hypothetical protein
LWQPLLQEKGLTLLEISTQGLKTPPTATELDVVHRHTSQEIRSGSTVSQGMGGKPNITETQRSTLCFDPFAEMACREGEQLVPSLAQAVCHEGSQ